MVKRKKKRCEDKNVGAMPLCSPEKARCKNKNVGAMPPCSPESKKHKPEFLANPGSCFVTPCLNQDKLLSKLYAVIQD